MMIVFALLMVLIPVGGTLLGYLAALRLASRGTAFDGASLRRQWIVAGAFAALCLGWVGIGYGARWLADSDLPWWRTAAWLAHSGWWQLSGLGASFLIGIVAATLHRSATGGSHANPLRVPLVQMKRMIVILAVMFIGTMAWRTAPASVGLPPGLTRDEAGHIRQSGNLTCGPVSLGNLLEIQFGRRSPSEKELAALAGTTSSGTTPQGLMRAGTALGLQVVACRRMSLEELLAFERPAIVSISTLPTVRHATLFLGPVSSVELEVGGQRLAFVDPAYGYREVSRERFLRIWYGKTLVFDGSHGLGPTDSVVGAKGETRGL